MSRHLKTLGRIVERAASYSTFHKVDPDLAAEAGMDGNLARLLQAARDLDAESNRRAEEDPILRDVLG